MKKHYRNNINLRNDRNIVFQALNWKAIDEYINDELIYNIYVFGVTELGESISVLIEKFTPYFYIKIPKEHQKTWTISETGTLLSYIESKLWRNKNDIIRSKCKIVEKKDIYGFTNETNYKFLQIVFKNETAYKKTKYILCPGNNKPKPLISSLSTSEICFELYEANIEPFIRLCHQRNIKLSGWININKYVDNENDLSRCQIDIKCDWKVLEGIDKNDIANIRIASFDIECISYQAKMLKKEIFPDYSKSEDKITQIGTTFYDYSSKKTIEYIATNASSDGEKIETDKFYVDEFNNEKDLLIGWINVIIGMDPDIIMGYNSNNFDWKYIYERCKRHDIEDKLFKLSRLNHFRSEWIAEQKLSSSARGENVFRYLESPGIINTDLMTIIKQNFKLPSYKLNEVAKEFISDQKEGLTPLQLFQTADGTAEEIYKVLVYCVKDCTLLIDILVKKCIISNTLAMSCVCHVPYNYIEYKGQQIKVHSQILYEARLNNYVVPTIPYKSSDDTSDEKFTGATVLEPKPGAYFEPVTGLDFASLYPSIMIANNLSYETMVKGDEFNNLKDVVYKDITWKENEDKEDERIENVRFVQNKKGILPIILEKLWTERKKIKNEMKGVKRKIKEVTDDKIIKQLENEYEVCDGFQLAMKVSMNSIYGFTGANFGRLPEKRIAASVTAEGRRMILECKNYLLDNYDCEVVYGDTDSVYVKFNTDFDSDTKEHMVEIFKISEVVAKELSNLFIKPIEMEFEKVMYPFIIFSKKRYACLIYTNVDNYDYIDYKGIQVVRRDNCEFVKNKSMEIFQILLLEKDVDKAVILARKYINDLIQGYVSIKDLIISKSLKGWGSYEFDKQFLCMECNKKWYINVKEKGNVCKKYSIMYWDLYNSKKGLKENIDNFIKMRHYCNFCCVETEYRSNQANIAHVALARKMEERDKYNCPQVGERVPYVFKKTKNPRDIQFQKVEDPKYLVANNIDLDYNYYWEHQFKSAIETIFEPILKDKMRTRLYSGILYK